MIKAFISHSSKQKEFAQELYKKIGGDFCYIDCYDFQPAFRTIDEIYTKIDSCTIFVLLLSKDSLASDWVKKEISAAIRKFSPNQLDRFWPFIIDPELTVDECPDWMRKDECFNLRFFRSPEQLRKDIEQKFRRIVWMENPGIMARETTLIGRQEELGQFEDIRYSKGGSEIRALVISGRTGVGKDAFARQCLYLMKYEHETEPYRISLENKSSIEDFIVQLNLITDVYSNDELKDKLNGTLEQKIDLAVDLLNSLFKNKSVVFIEDNLACVLPTRDIPEWLGDIISHEHLEKKLALFIKSRLAPNAYIRQKYPRLAHVQLHPLSRKDRKKLFYNLAERYDLNDIGEKDVDFFVDRLLLSPSQIHHALMAVKNIGLTQAKIDIDSLVDIGDERAKPLMDHFKQYNLSINVMVILARFEFLGFDVLEEIFEGQEKELQESIADMIVYGIVTMFGPSDEYIRLDNYVCNYISRNKIDLPADLESAVAEIIEKRVVSANITRDVSVYFYDLRQKIASGRFSSDAYLVPSVIIKAVVETYNKKEYNQVIQICDKVLTDCHNFFGEVVWELTYWLCLALCRTLKDKENNRERFWNTVGYFKGADADFLKGFYHRYDENFAKAESFFKKALENSPNMDRAKHELVTVLQRQGKYQEALGLAKENYEKSNGDNSYHAHAYFQCLVRNPRLSGSDLSMIKKLMKDVEESFSDKRYEMLASMEIDYASLIEHKKPEEVLELIREKKKHFPQSKSVEISANAYLKKQGLR